MGSGVIEIPLTQGFIAWIDVVDADFAALTWRVRLEARTQYARRNTPDGGQVSLHRLVMRRVLGRDLAGDEEIDHKDRNGLNNTRANLRLSTHVQNMANRGLSKNNTSGAKGVSYNASTRRWEAQITRAHVLYRLGSFETCREAARAYNRKAVEFYGEFAWLNPVDEEGTNGR